MAANVYLEVDASELEGEIERLRSVMKPAEFDRCMYRIFQRTEGHVRRILRTDLPKDYHVKASEISSAVKHAKVSQNAATGVGCSIPVVGVRRSIGSKIKATGGARGWSSLRRGRYRITANIVKDHRSVLPAPIPQYNNDPFRNFGSKIMPNTFVRETKKRLPIQKVVGIAVPQMPTNRSEPEVQEDIKTYMHGRIQQEFNRLIAGK